MRARLLSDLFVVEVQLTVAQIFAIDEQTFKTGQLRPTQNT